MDLTSVRTGTATGRRCMPMRVSPMSMPAWAWIRSTAQGEANPFQAAVEKEPPAFSWGFTLTISRPYFSAASSSMIMARFKCSQHWAAR